MAPHAFAPVPQIVVESRKRAAPGAFGTRRGERDGSSAPAQTGLAPRSLDDGCLSRAAPTFRTACMGPCPSTACAQVRSALSKQRCAPCEHPHVATGRRRSGERTLDAAVVALSKRERSRPLSSEDTSAHLHGV
jgi:hypothetical protein